ncbi:hypothetical protein AKJ09_06757 [Labilithrix luteola]|uniref:Uncharacterized protein n=1 Tax=Labilithrix luteola TaxID=1391654 RepID=A0A0K1Q2U7_9BACT|nr:hypothetical protein AKJ09_06757 [Labilithrix luteola]
MANGEQGELVSSARAFDFCAIREAQNGRPKTMTTCGSTLRTSLRPHRVPMPSCAVIGTLRGPIER